jgi:peroxiredoxin
MHRPGLPKENNDKAMIIKNSSTIIGLLALLTVTTLAQQKKTDDFKLSGSVAPNAKGRVYLYYEKDGALKTDSGDVAEGRFALEGQLAEPVFARLSFQPSDLSIKRLNILNFYLEPGSLKISSRDSLKNVILSGSKSDQDFLPIREALRAFNAKLGILNQEARNYTAAKDSANLNVVISKMGKLEADLKNDTYRKFVQQYPASPVSLYALSQVAGYHLNAEEIEPLFKSLTREVRNSHAGKTFADKIQIAKATSIGYTMPDLSQPDTSGKLVSLSSLKGKYVLVDFWASWCQPCRAENPNLVKAFNAYKDKGFTILGVSLDKNKEKWLEAIRVDKLYWTQISDLKYWDNDIAKKLDIRSIPQNILLDPSGKIIARNLRGDELSKTLVNVLKSND